MAKAVIKIGWDEYVMEVDDAVALAKLLMGGERYKQNYVSASLGGSGSYTYHIWQDDSKPNETCEIRIISDALYNMAKLAGEPPKNN